MRRFLLKIFYFSIPALFLLLPPLILLKTSGECFVDLDEIITSNKKYLIGYAYNESNYKYIKWREIDVKTKQNVLALGSSRVLQFRENMFQSSFYNAGFTVNSISEFIPFLLSIDKKKYPEVLLINLDQWMFNANWDPIEDETSKYIPSINADPLGASFKEAWIDLINGKFNLSNPFENDSLIKVGINAYFKGSGFRKDGSKSYYSQINMIVEKNSTTVDSHFDETLIRIKEGNKRFQYGNDINNRAILRLSELLDFCKRNKIFLIAIVPPFAKKINEQLISSNKYTYIDKILPSIKPLFLNSGFELWDFSCLEDYGSSDEEMLDGFHAGEVAQLKMLIKMLENNSKLNDYTNVERLKLDLKNRVNNYTVYNY